MGGREVPKDFNLLANIKNNKIVYLSRAKGLEDDSLTTVTRNLWRNLEAYVSEYTYRRHCVKPMTTRTFGTDFVLNE